ncbi:LytR/AlgR family response regulator transcription factor [Arcicella lustrica]|uniref:LytTR family DNA-binding domain-containing protein n=1 Tax=Arcicella lustrica TaxID=2984196 RepID=A0ABU5SG18_9BACT|nr:LytTR family DNA-binding domain-containing protein [Arcicella sp. DC25W]MEA5426201.1 LytTR family DNA-binding domain-containing protein [Arcicella sp. DC25W]
MKELRLVLVEDEVVTARNLEYVLKSLNENISILAILQSVSEAVNWFENNQTSYDLVFMDIRLADGLSFDIFKKVNINRPVIFVTAYNDYAIQAFKNNGIDYILKPFDEQEIEQALAKFENLTKPSEQELDGKKLAQLLDNVNAGLKSYKKSFLVHYRDKLVPLETAKIAWFYTSNEIVHAHTLDDKQYIMEFTMEQLEQQIDPALFFRANRQFIVNRMAILEIEFYFNGRLSVKVKPEPTEHILISKARVPAFKSWMNN